jgi:hypothetical protein
VYKRQPIQAIILGKQDYEETMKPLGFPKNIIQHKLFNKGSD